MNAYENVKNAQRMAHILEAVRRIKRSLAGVAREDFQVDEDKQGPNGEMRRRIEDSEGRLRSNAEGARKGPRRSFVVSAEAIAELRSRL